MRELCEGFQMVRIDESKQRIEERLYAELPDGRVYATDWLGHDTAFDRTSKVWKRVDFRPGAAKFIGNYPIPYRLQD